MICTYAGTTDRKIHGGRRSSVWTISRATVLLTVCLLVAGLFPSAVGAAETPPPTCSTAISNNPGLVSDCEILLAVRDTLAGTGALNWSAAVAMDTWDGITLSGTPPRVTKIILYYKRLIGSIPPELGDLTNLEWVDLGMNELSGSIPPELGDLTNLKGLNLVGNELSGSIPLELGDLTNLEWLDLDANELSGSIPPELGDLTSLEGLDLSANELSGSIPPELGDLTNLRGLDLASNELSGSIPPELGNLTNLEWLYLYDNELNGPIPPELGDLTNLEWLDLQGNDLCIPAAHQDEAFFRDLDFPICIIEIELAIAVSPATSVPHTETVTLTAQVSDPAQVASYRWAHVGGWHRIGTQQSLTLGGAGWPNSPGTRTFQAIVTLNDGSQVIAEQAITFTDPPPSDVLVSISVSPDTSVSYTEEVTLTAEVSDPAQVASYRWAHVGGWHRIGTQQSLTLGGAGWPNSPGTRTFQAIVTLNDGSQVTAEQSLAFTNP